MSRAVALGAVMASAVCGGLIGHALGELGGASAAGTLVAALVGATLGAAGVAMMATLVLRSKSEWANEAGAASLRSRSPRRAGAKTNEGRR